MNASVQRLLNTFVTGALAALPLAATILIFVWGSRVVVDYLGPDRLIGAMLSQHDANGVRSMSPVWLHFGGVGGAAVLGLCRPPGSRPPTSASTG